MPNFLSNSEEDHNCPISWGSAPLDRAFCFGCDEGRNGIILRKKVTFPNIPKVYDECICDGCENTLNLLRPFLPPLVQLESHEGDIIWGFPTWFFNSHLRQYSKLEIDESYSDSYITAIRFTDGGHAEKILNILLYEGTKYNLSKPRSQNNNG